MSTIVTLDNVTKTYGEGDVAVQALKGVSLDLAEGAFAAVAGPSGSGKSTIVREQQAWSARDSYVALVEGTRLRPRRLLTSMLSQYGVRFDADDDDQLEPDDSRPADPQPRAEVWVSATTRHQLAPKQSPPSHS